MATMSQNSLFLLGRVEGNAGKFNNNSENWERRHEALNELVRLFRAQHPADLTFEVLRPLKLPLQASLKDLRSVLVRDACKLLETLAVMKADGVVKLVHEVMPTLIDQMASGNKVIKGSIGDCVLHLVHEVRMRSEIGFLCNHACTNKSKEARDACQHYVLEMLTCWGSPYVNAEANALQAAIAKGLEDSSPESRGFARESFVAFVEMFPDRRELIFSSVTLRTQKLLANLQRETPGSSTASNDSSGSSHATTAATAASEQPSSPAHTQPPSPGGAASPAPTSPASSCASHDQKRSPLFRPSRIQSLGKGSDRRRRSASFSPATSHRRSSSSSPRGSFGLPTPRKSAEDVDGMSSPLGPSGGPRRASHSPSLSPSSSSPNSLSRESPTDTLRRKLESREAVEELEMQEQAFEIGDRVCFLPPKSGSTPTKNLASLSGVVRFCGKTKFAMGTWAGVELDEPTGTHNGTLKGVQYFTCAENHGVFVRPTQLQRPPPTAVTKPTTAAAMATRDTPSRGASRPKKQYIPTSSADTTADVSNPSTRGSKVGKAGSSRGVASDRDEALLVAHKKHVGELLALVEKEMALIAKVEAAKGRTESAKARREHRQGMTTIKNRQLNLIERMQAVTPM